MLLNNQQIIEEIKKEIKICIEMNENENTTTQNLRSEEHTSELQSQMYKTDFWTLWEKARVGCFKRTALKHVYSLG